MRTINNADVAGARSSGQFKTPWTEQEALDLIRTLQSRIGSIGYGIALAGSVLMKGESSTDVDIILFPYDTSRQDYESLKEAMTDHGLHQVFDQASSRRYRERHNHRDRKHTEIWKFGSKRVDIFFLS